MKIAIDIDNTVFTNNSIIYKFLNNQQSLGTIDATELEYSKIEPTIPQKGLIKKIFPFINPSKFVAFKDSIDVINLLFENGHEIVFLSNRPSILKGPTLELLDRFGVKYDSLILGCKNKHLFCKDFEVDVLIDDQEKTCLNAARTGTKAICFNPHYNSINNDNKDLVARLYHARTWNVIEHMISYMDVFQLFTDGFNAYSEGARENRLLEFFKTSKPLYRELVLSKYSETHKLKPYVSPTTIVALPDELLRELEQKGNSKGK